MLMSKRGRRTRSRKTPQLVSINRAFLILGLLGLLAMVIYYYWGQKPAKDGRDRQSSYSSLKCRQIVLTDKHFAEDFSAGPC